MLLLAVMHSMMSAMMLARMTILMGNGLDEERSRLGGLEHLLECSGSFSPGAEQYGI
jgi:hypothetical protein